MKRSLYYIFLLLFIYLNLGYNVPVRAFENGLAGFSIRVNGFEQPYRVFAFYLLPDEWLEFEVETDVLNLDSSAGTLELQQKNKWRWRHNQSGGPYHIKITDHQNQVMTLNLFVLVPYSKVKNGYLEGYRIGQYPEKPLKKNAIYTRPKGFVRVTTENKDTLVSPHFRLSQFLCKQEAGWPRFLILKPKLQLKLEELLKVINKTLGADSIHIMSGYRTPYYNKAIGNVKYSRHLWGGAADIFIDVDPVDDQMDDLDKNGKINIDDAKVLYAIIDTHFKNGDVRFLVGGLSKYRRTAAHGPFVHMDVRGYAARW